MFGGEFLLADEGGCSGRCVREGVTVWDGGGRREGIRRRSISGRTECSWGLEDDRK